MLEFLNIGLSDDWIYNTSVVIQLMVKFNIAQDVTQKVTTRAVFGSEQKVSHK